MSEQGKYGEPWFRSTEVGGTGVVRGDDGLERVTVCRACADSHRHRDFAERIIVCVNACSGMQDPAAEIAAKDARIAKLELKQLGRLDPARVTATFLKKDDEIAALREEVERLRGIERVAKDFVDYLYRCHEDDYLHYGEKLEAVRAALEPKS